MSQRDPIREADRLRQWLGDPAVVNAFDELERMAFEAFRNARTDEERLTAWAEARAVDSLRARLQAVIDNGDMERRRRDETR